MQILGYFIWAAVARKYEDISISVYQVVAYGRIQHLRAYDIWSSNVLLFLGIVSSSFETKVVFNHNNNMI